MKTRWLSHIWLVLLLAPVTVLVGCGGSNGSDGDPGAPGKSAYEIAVENGFKGDLQDWVMDQLGVGPEVCAYCHNGEVARNGESHQKLYDELFQQDVIKVSDVTYSNDGADDTVTFKMTMKDADGIDQPFNCEAADSVNIGFTQYDATTNRFVGTGSGGRVSIDTGDRQWDEGTNTCTVVSPENDALEDLRDYDGYIVVYGEDGLTDEVGHIELAKYPFASLPYDTGNFETGDYVSAANASGCENCHQTPYYKHGYIRGDISGDSGLDLNFYACKVCHVSDANGYHPEWRLSADNPQRWAEFKNGSALTAEEKAKYGIKTRLMNDVHITHSMEFPYPQPMTTCANCHGDKLEQTLSDENFILENCLSCHPVTGGTDTYKNAEGNYETCDPDVNLELDPDDLPEDCTVDTKDMALKTYWAKYPTPDDNVLSIHLAILAAPDGDPSDDCNVCHSANPTVAEAPRFSELHTGYEPRIYYKDAADGKYKHYRDAITASIDSVTLDGTVLDVQFSASGTAGGLSADDIVPTIQISFYGYDTKDFILSNHTKNSAGDRMEKTMGEANALFTEVTNEPGDWEVTLDMAAFATGPDDIDIPAYIDDGVIRKAEVMVRPLLKNADGDSVGLNAVSKTIDVTVEPAANPFVADYFKGDSALVKVEDGCNRCHDQLAVTFHSGDRGGNIVVCRSCHVVTSGGSHLEGQSRSIDSYVHAIHRFQAFDVDDVDFNDPVEKWKYKEHIEFLFPDFAAINCERCHTDERAVDNGMRGTFDIPDQSRSMPGLLSATDESPGIIDTPEVVVGPAARACGGCHRAQFIKEEDSNGYTLFNEHTKRFGYRVENDDDDNMLYSIIDYIMGLFQ